MNLCEKFYAILVHPDIRVWHYHTSRPPVKPFVCQTQGGPDADAVVHAFDGLEEMIEAAYATIDPLRKPLTSRNISPLK